MKKYWAFHNEILTEQMNYSYTAVYLASEVEAEICNLTGIIQSRDIDIGNYKYEMKEKDAKIARLKKGIKAVEDLINESSGVDGLHLNGDTAPWGELRTGGRFPEWLRDFDEALVSVEEENKTVKEAIAERDKACKAALEIFNVTHEPALKIYMEACDEANKICNEIINTGKEGEWKSIGRTL